MSEIDFVAPLCEVVSRIRQSCQDSKRRFVVAESCTAGLVAAMLGRQAGISSCFCGSSVTYRNDSKHQWLAVVNPDLVDPGPVSAVVTKQMSEGVLTQTPEADIAAAITGHLGPDAPVDLDGVVYIAVSIRGDRGKIITACQQWELNSNTRNQRQQEASLLVLQTLERVLSLLSGALAVIDGQQDMVKIGSDAMEFVFPGSFKPLHAGHTAMARYIEEHHSQRVFFEISVTNVDKTALSFNACLSRSLPLCFSECLIISRAPTFLDKAQLYGSVQFITGVDTISRVGSRRYYGGDEQREQVLQQLVALDCRFIVFGREMSADCQTGREQQKQFVTLEQLSIPPALRQLCCGVPESEFRHDQSSRDLR